MKGHTKQTKLISVNWNLLLGEISESDPNWYMIKLIDKINDKKVEVYDWVHIHPMKNKISKTTIWINKDP